MTFGLSRYFDSIFIRTPIHLFNIKMSGFFISSSSLLLLLLLFLFLWMLLWCLLYQTCICYSITMDIHLENDISFELQLVVHCQLWYLRMNFKLMRMHKNNSKIYADCKSFNEHHFSCNLTAHMSFGFKEK